MNCKQLSAVLLTLWLALSVPASGAAPPMLCQPQVGPDQTIVTAAQRNAAAKSIEPPLVDIFAWPDGPFGVLKFGSRYAFFATDGGNHRNGKAGSVTVTFGEHGDPLDLDGRHRVPIDVSIEPDRQRNPDYQNYSYIGGGPVYLVPRGMPGAGSLLTVYHAERATSGAGGFYSLLGLARSIDQGRSWHDIGEIIQANQPYRPNLQGYDLGISQLVVDPTRTYFYVYFPDWIANGTPIASTQTIMSVARVRIDDLLRAAFATRPNKLPPFEKYYAGRWNQPGINGLSSDLEAGSYPGDASVTYNAYLRRYVVVADDTNKISYGESPDGLAWTSRLVIFSKPNRVYARGIGTGEDPNVLGSDFFVYYTYRNDWTTATVGRFAVSCR